jgi:hypothetical protein
MVLVYEEKLDSLLQELIQVKQDQDIKWEVVVEVLPTLLTH